MSAISDRRQSIEDVQEKIGVRLGERGDFVAMKTAEVGDDVLAGESPDRCDLEELHEMMDEIARMVAAIEELEDVEGR